MATQTTTSTGAGSLPSANHPDNSGGQGATLGSQGPTTVFPGVGQEGIFELNIFINI